MIEEFYKVEQPNSRDETLNFIDDLQISQNYVCDDELINPDIVYQAICCVYVNTNDVNFGFQSNALRNATNITRTYLTAILQAFLIYSYIPKDLLFCYIKRVIKDKLGDRFNS